MIEVNEGKVRVKGPIDIVEMEILFLLTSIYDKEPESLKTILQTFMEYMEGKLELHHMEVQDDSF